MCIIFIIKRNDFPPLFKINFYPKWFYEWSDGIGDQPPINNAGGNRSGPLVFHWGIVLSSGPERSDLFFFFFPFFSAVVRNQVCSNWACTHLLEELHHRVPFNGHLQI